MKKILLLGLAFMLTACDSEPNDLREWINQTEAASRKKVKQPDIPTIEPMQVYVPPPQPELHAFNTRRLRSNIAVANRPDLNRPKEVLEEYELNDLKYVGSLQNGSKVSAFIETGGRTYTVHRGSHIGQNYGQIVSIQEDIIRINEKIETDEGGWESRCYVLIKNANSSDTCENYDSNRGNIVN